MKVWEIEVDTTGGEYNADVFEVTAYNVVWERSGNTSHYVMADDVRIDFGSILSVKAVRDIIDRCPECGSPTVKSYRGKGVQCISSNCMWYSESAVKNPAQTNMNRPKALNPSEAAAKNDSAIESSVIKAIEEINATLTIAYYSGTTVPIPASKFPTNEKAKKEVTLYFEAAGWNIKHDAGGDQRDYYDNYVFSAKPIDRDR